MDDKLNNYLESLVSNVLESANFTSLSDEQKKLSVQKIRQHFQNVIFDTAIDSMNDEQLLSIKDIPMGSAEMIEKIEQISSQIPNLAQILEKKLLEEVEAIKNNPQTIEQH